MNNTVTSEYVKRGNESERKARLLVAAKEEVARLESALKAGWDVAKDLASARKSVEAYSS